MKGGHRCCLSDKQWITSREEPYLPCVRGSTHRRHHGQRPRRTRRASLSNAKPPPRDQVHAGPYPPQPALGGQPDKGPKFRTTWPIHGMLMAMATRELCRVAWRRHDGEPALFYPYAAMFDARLPRPAHITQLPVGT